MSNISLDLDNNYNLQNILASYVVTKYLNIPIKFFLESVQKFKGLPYRSSIIYNSKEKYLSWIKINPSKLNIVLVNRKSFINFVNTMIIIDMINVKI